MAAAAFFAVERRAGDGFGNGEQMFQVDRRVPAGVVFAMAVNGDLSCAFLKFAQPVQSLHHFVLAPHDADELLHHLLQIMLHLVRALRRVAPVVAPRSNGSSASRAAASTCASLI